MVIAGIPLEEIRHTRAVQDWLAEGRQEGEAAVTLRLLNLRCGPLSDASTGWTGRVGDADPDRAHECLIALACADHAQDIVAAGKDQQRSPERATERVAVLMTPTEKAAYADRANSLGLSLGQFFREAGTAYAGRNAEAETRSLAEAEALEAALRQLERSTSRTEQSLDAALAEVRAALDAQP